jgi:hypothetical protein
MTKTKWLGSAAVMLVLGIPLAFAQTPPSAPQKHDEGPRAQAPAKEERSEDRQKARSAQESETKAGQREAQEPRRDDKKAQQQAQEPSHKEDTKQPTRQSQDQDRDQRSPANAERRDREKDHQEARQPADQKQQQSRDQQKQDNRAAEKDSAQKSQQQSQQPMRNNQAAQPPAGSKSDTAQDRPRESNTGQAANQQGQSTSTNVSEQQRTQIRDGLSHDRAAINRENQNLNISVNIGTELPSRVRARPLPPDIVRIAPQYRGYDYTVVEDRIVIVEPRSHKVVEVIDEGGRAGGPTTSQASFERHILTQDQRQTLRQTVQRTATTGSTSSRTALDSGCLTLQNLPDDLARANPDLRNFKMLAIGEQIVLVDPQQQKVVEVID